MTSCRVCARPLDEPIYEDPGPALSSIFTKLQIPTRAFACASCGHAQSDDIPNIDHFYDSVYRISLESEEHDQIFMVAPDGRVIFRTDHQADTALRLLDLPRAAAILDYGAAKATTLRKMCVVRPDLRPHVFDVSSDYVSSWREWLNEAATATYHVPQTWRGSFDVVMSHFAIEHVAEPVHFIRQMGELLKPSGKLLISMPDLAGNPGDMMVADHLSHFSDASVRHALALGGFHTISVDTHAFPGALFAVATKGQPIQIERDAGLVTLAFQQARDIGAFWKRATDHVDHQAGLAQGCKVAIYGAGFYGTWIHGRIADKVEISTFLDSNPHLQRTLHMGTPVLPPTALPADVQILFVGLNPRKAHDIIAGQPWFRRPGLRIVWLERQRL